MTPFRVLFVCTANICRSSTAELMARAAVPEGTDLVFESAGTHGYAEAPVEAVMAAALPDGLDLTAFRSRPLTTEMLTSADLVLTMEAAHRDFILRDHPSLFSKVLTPGPVRRRRRERSARARPGRTDRPRRRLARPCRSRARRA